MSVIFEHTKYEQQQQVLQKMFSDHRELSNRMFYGILGLYTLSIDSVR